MASFKQDELKTKAQAQMKEDYLEQSHAELL